MMNLHHPLSSAVFPCLTTLLCITSGDLVGQEGHDSRTVKPKPLALSEIADYVAEPFGRVVIDARRWKSVDAVVANAVVESWVRTKQAGTAIMLRNAANAAFPSSNRPLTAISRQRIRSVVANPDTAIALSLSEQTYLSVRLEALVKNLGPIAAPALVRFGEAPVGPTEHVIEQLVSAATDSDNPNCGAASLYMAKNHPLVPCPQLATDVLLVLASDEDGEIKTRTAAIWELADRRDEVTQIVPVLKRISHEFLEDDAVAVIAYLDGANPDTQRWLVAGAKHHAYDKERRSKFLNAIVGLAVKHRSMREAITSMLDSEASDFHLPARLGSRPERSHVFFRSHLVEIMTPEAARLPDLAPALYAVMTDGRGKRFGYDHKDLRKEAAIALGRIKNGKEYLLRAQAHGVDEAAHGLVLIDDEASVDDAIRQLSRGDLDWEAEIGYYRLLRRKGTKATAAIPVLRNKLRRTAIRSKPFEYIVHALAAIDSSGRQAAVDHMVELCNRDHDSPDNSSSVLFGAMDLLAACAPQSRTAYPIMKEAALGDHSGISDVAVTALVRLAQKDQQFSDDVVEILIRLLDRKYGVTKPTLALEEMGPSAKKAVPALVRAFERDPSVNVARVIGNHSPKVAFDLLRTPKHYKSFDAWWRERADELLADLEKTMGSRASDPAPNLNEKLLWNVDLTSTLSAIVDDPDAYRSARPLLERGLTQRSHPELAVRCAYTILALEPSHSEADALLRQFQCAPDSHVRWMANELKP